jgi:hypothetical protein
LAKHKSSNLINIAVGAVFFGDLVNDYAFE